MPATKPHSDLTLWTCPKCRATVKARAIEVTHRCPSNKSLWTAFVK